MPATPRVSIITSVYNHERYLDECVTSVLSQNLPDAWELLLWDDGSQDGSREKAQEWARRYPQWIRCFQHPDRGNRGQEVTRNEALSQSRGSLVCLLDSDDFWLPGKLEAQLKRWDQEVNPVLVYGPHWILVEETGERVLQTHIDHPEGYVFESLIQRNFIVACSALFAKEALGSEIRFASEYGAIGEYPVWLELARKGRFLYEPQGGAVWRLHGGNTGTRRRVQARRELVHLAEMWRDKLRVSRGSESEAVDHAWSQYVYDLAVILLEEGHDDRAFDEGLALLERLQRESPLFSKDKVRFMGTLARWGGRSAVACLRELKLLRMKWRDPSQWKVASRQSL